MHFTELDEYRVDEEREEMERNGITDDCSPVEYDYDPDHEMHAHPLGSQETSLDEYEFMQSVFG